MRTPRGPSRSLWSLHRIVSTSDVLVVTNRHTRVEILFARCAAHRRHVDIAAYIFNEAADRNQRSVMRLTGWSEDPASPQRFPDKTGQSPRTPSVVFRIPELSPEDDLLSESCSDPLSTSVPFRLLPLRAPTSGKLRSSSRLAPSSSHRPTLRSTGEEDARCVEPTSATHTNYVHPHLVRSRLAPLVAQRGRPPETKAPDDTIGGPSVSRHPRPLRRTVPACLLRAPCFVGFERGRFLPTARRRPSL